MAFLNRKSAFPSRRKLEVRSVEKNGSGEIVSMTVDVIRAEGQIQSEGTPLTAESLNAAVLDLIESKMSQVSTQATTQHIYTSNTTVATTEFVWNVLTSLGYNKPNPNPNPGSGGGSGSSGT